MRIRTLSMLVATAWLAGVRGVAAQDINISLPVDSIEYLLAFAPFELGDLAGTRGDGDRTDRANMFFDSTTYLLTKFAPAPEGGEDFNNVPAYEVAAYRIQRLFLDDSEVVVPPTVMRAFPLDWYRNYDSDVDATFRGVNSVVVVLQAFVQFVTDEDVWDRDRFQADTLYARHWANANLLTYLIHHSDSNQGNLLISTFSSNPRVFAVDNGVAFNSPPSNRGTQWRRLLVNRFPARTVARLQSVTEEDLHRTLGVLAQWAIEDDQLVRTEPTENIDPREGVRRRDGIVQFGLTREEIEDVWYRLEEFLGGLASGRYSTF